MTMSFDEFYPSKIHARVSLIKWDQWVHQGFKVEWLLKFADTVLEHIDAVQQCGRKLGIDEKQLAAHDLSKFSDEEFPQYARQFNASSTEKDPNGWARAWLHHIHCNPHHWQYWIYSEGYAPRGADAPGGVLEMPEEYVWEMIADWQGASLIYDKTTDMSKWLTKNVDKIVVHPQTAQYLETILSDLGYGDLFILHRFKIPAYDNMIVL